LGLRVTATEDLRKARSGLGGMRLELRRIGAGRERIGIDIGWEIEETADPEKPRLLRLEATGAKGGRGEPLLITLALAAGQYDIVALDVHGRLVDAAGVSRVVDARPDV